MPPPAGRPKPTGPWWRPCTRATSLRWWWRRWPMCWPRWGEGRIPATLEEAGRPRPAAEEAAAAGGTGGQARAGPRAAEEGGEAAWLRLYLCPVGGTRGMLTIRRT